MILALIFSVASWAAEVVNINTASADELAAALKGVGPSKAEAIVTYRETNGA
ncbi:MAG TPA: helix-hairpin-helix domain-containing protein, partial [Xanthomonadales bacterium]|nr:helix-hairpin-helix domain-containing protein [Xanthomonadales bacterium]